MVIVNERKIGFGKIDEHNESNRSNASESIERREWQNGEKRVKVKHAENKT